MKVVNDEITKCGLKYIGHFNSAIIQVFGNHFGLEIPGKRLGDFCRLFPDVNWENGEFINVLIGRYIRLIYDEGGKLQSIKHITQDKEYKVEVEE